MIRRHVRIPRVPRRVAGAVIVLLLAACDGPTTVQSLSGRYALVSADGRLVPALVDTSERGFGVVLADTLIFENMGRVTRALTFRRVAHVLGTDDVSRSQLSLAYRLGPGVAIAIGSFRPCPPNALCAPNDTGSVGGNGMELVTYWYGNRTRLTFARLPE